MELVIREESMPWLFAILWLLTTFGLIVSIFCIWYLRNRKKMWKKAAQDWKFCAEERHSYIIHMKKHLNYWKTRYESLENILSTHNGSSQQGQQTSG